jgi:hypothetical protein
MKKVTLFLAVILLVTGCAKKEALVPVRVRINDFSISQEEISSKTASDVVDYTGVKAITLAFYTADGTEQYKVTQMRADATTYTTFGEFDLSLPMGSYTMVVLGYGLNDGEPAITLTGPTSATFGDYPARETFVATQTVSITNTDALELNATLNRVVAKLKVLSTDGRTANANSVRITTSGGSKAFNPSTGLATTNTGFSNTVNITSTAVGSVAGPVSYLFLATDEQTVNVTIDVLDENNQTISHKVVNNVPLQRNRMTKLVGSIFTASGDGSFQVETEWLPETEVNF